MRTASIVLAFALLIPILGNLLSAYQYYVFNSHNQFIHQDNWFIIRSNAPGFIYLLIVVVVAIVLNTQKKYLINTVMCITVIGGYIIHTALFLSINFLFSWLKLG
jgi:hypothetical protein